MKKGCTIPFVYEDALNKTYIQNKNKLSLDFKEAKFYLFYLSRKHGYLQKTKKKISEGVWIAKVLFGIIFCFPCL